MRPFRRPAARRRTRRQARWHNLVSLDAQVTAKPGEEARTFSSAAFATAFAELRVDEATDAVRVGRPIGSMGRALLERAEWDPCCGKVMIVNAVWHAASRRIRSLPITPESLLGGG